MVCIKCAKQLKIRDMYNHKNISCCSCDKNYKYIERITQEAQKFYIDRIIKLSDLDWYFSLNDKQSDVSYREQIKEIALELSVLNKIYCNYEDKKRVICNIVGKAYQVVIDKLRDNTLSYIYFFIICFEYNRFIAGARVLNLASRKSGGNDIITQDAFVNLVCEFDRKNYNVELEVELAKERWALEIGISICYNLIQSNENISLDFNKMCESEYIGDIFKYILIIFEGKELLNTKDLKNYDLIIDENGSFFLDSNNDSIERYFDFINSDRNSLTSELVESSPLIINDEELNRNIKSYFGLSLNEMDKFRNGILNLCNLDELIIGSEDLWIKFIENFADIEYNDAKKFFQHSIKRNYIDIDKLLKIETKNSISRKSLLKVNNIYFSLYSIFLFMITNIIQDLIIGEVNDYDELKPKLEKYYKRENDKFELEVVEFLKQNYENSIIIHDLNEGDFNLLNNIEFPGQIDILFLYKGQIYIIECKNYNLKITSKSEENLVQRIKTKVYQKMKKKILFINQNREYLLKKYEQDIHSYNDEIKGIVAISNFTSVSIVENIPIVNYKEIRNIIL